MVSTAFVGFFASAGDYDPQVWTDKDEYCQGETVYIYGEGFAHWVDVSIELSHSDFGTKLFTEKPDYYGKFLCDDYIAEWVTHDESVKVTVTQVLEDEVLVATTEFWDPAAYAEGWTLWPQPKFTKGSVSGYFEGDTVPFIVGLDRAQLGGGDTVTVWLAFDYCDHNSPTTPVYGIDYLTAYHEFPVTPPYNTYEMSSEPFWVDPAEGTFTEQVEELPRVFAEGGIQELMIWRFTFVFEDDVPVATIRFGAHLAVTSVAAGYDPAGLGAGFYPGAALHVNLFDLDPSANEGALDVPIAAPGILIPPEMTLDKCCDPETVGVGEDITFRLEWTNWGEADAAKLVIGDELPANLDLDGSSFLFWTSEDMTPEYPTDELTIIDNSFYLTFATWRGTGPGGEDDPLTGYLEFTATVLPCAPGQYENLATATYTDDHCGYYDPVEACCSFCVASAPEVEVEKTGPEYAHVGDVITYEYTITNIGPVDLVDVDAYDDMIGEWVVLDESLGVGESETFYYDYEVQDEDGETLTNCVEVTAESAFGGIAEASDCWTVDILRPEISVTKSADKSCGEIGERIIYTITVRNPSAETMLYDVTVDDPLLGSWSYDTLSPGESKVIVASLFVNAEHDDPFVNTVTATGYDMLCMMVEAEASADAVDVLHPMVEVTKEADLRCAEEGEVVTYWINVTNPSWDTDLVSVLVWDYMLDDEPLFDGPLAFGMTEYLGPFYYTVPRGVEEVVNTVYVDAFDRQGHHVADCDSWTVEIFHPDIAIYKWSDWICAEEGETVEFWIEVWNPSHDATMWADVYDPMLGGLLWSGYLAPSDSMPLGPYPYVVPCDTEWVINTAYVYAWDHQEHDEYAESTWEIEIFHPDIAIYKWSDWICAEEGETVEFWIEVWNPSHDATMWADVYDPMLGGLLWSGYLAPSDSMPLGPYPYVVPCDTEWVINTAYVYAWDHQEHDEYAESTWEIEIFHPDIEITKRATLECAHVGETITYWIAVSNPSHDATMTVDVYDLMFSSDPLWSGDLGPGGSMQLGPYDYVVPEDVEWVNNTAYVDAWDHQRHYRYAEDCWSVEILKPAISVTKIGPEEAEIGETITYYVNVTNTGDTELFNVYVMDSLVGQLAGPVDLGIGETLPLTYTFVVPAGEGMLDNYVSVCGMDRQETQVCDEAYWSVFKPGSISGFKTADLNANSVWDDGEPGLINWVIRLTGLESDGTPVDRTRLTDGSGFYEFTGLRAGTYTVSEEMQAGWAAVTPMSYDVAVGSGSVLSRSFGNMPYGHICGYKWLDANMNGVWDLGESAVPGWEISLYGEDVSGYLVDMSVLTDGTGYYCFSDLLPGVYTVSEEMQAGWSAVTPTSIVLDVSAVEPFAAEDVNFGNVRFGSICGYKWLDEFMNGAWDYYEVGLPGWTIELTGVLADGSEFGPIYTLTDCSGAYCFEGLLPGTYIVREIIPDGWVHITPDRYEVTIDMGDHVFCAKFGNVQYGKIDGYKFLDWDMDGFFDGIEPGLEGWAMTLEGWLNDGIPPMSYAGTYVGPFTVYTDADGYWCFDNLLPGVYKVTEESREHWFNTTPLSRVFVVGSGTYVFDQKFGNVPYTCFNGYKFEDVNGNGEWDQGEPGLPGWTIVIEGVRTDEVPVRIVLETDETGYWETCFNMLPGTYVIYEVPQEDWVASTPDSYLFEIPMCGDNMVYEFLFGNLRLGKICGYKYEDMNGNGMLDVGDVPIQGWTIYLSGAAIASTVTDEDGYFCFEGLMPGEYTVTEEERDGWVAMTPVSHAVTVVSGSAECVPVFLNVALSTIWGFKFEDINSNGVWDDGEPGIEGWTIYMMWNGDFTQYETQTDETGYFEFTGLMPSDYYYVWEETREHWVWTTQPYEEFSMMSGTNHRVPDFGNFHCVYIEVFKYEDVDSNGVYDRMDMPVEGWTFYLYDPTGALVGEAVTDETGYTGFWVCSAGTWVVVEEAREGVTPINPASGWLDVEVWSSAQPCPLMFGNFWDVDIDVFKYEDVNSNGQYDEGVDVPLEGWLIMLYLVDEDAWYFGYTDSDGMAYFVLSHSDSVFVYEDLQEGWCQITPGYPGYYELMVYSGSTFEVLEFGNFECVWIEVF